MKRHAIAPERLYFQFLKGDTGLRINRDQLIEILLKLGYLERDGEALYKTRSIRRDEVLLEIRTYLTKS